MSLADYLAKNYLKADANPGKERKKSKKRKRKDGAGLVIADDDTKGWENDGQEEDDEDGPMMVSSTTSAEFRKAKTNNWKSLSGAAATVPSGNGDDAAADAIIASAAAENAARAAADEDAPMVMDDGNGAGAEVEKLESGAHAGLQSGAQLAAQLAAKAKAERARMEREGAASMGQGAETIYRDASGRIVNVAMKRAEARAAEAAAAARKAEEEENAKGDVQRAEREQRRTALQDAKYMTLARHADDAELNDDLKAQQRWNDPAAQFMETTTAKKSKMGRPLYAGHAPPNRYGIKPGAKWDGVDRGNGFESEWFKARNRQTRLQALDYAWQMDE